MDITPLSVMVAIPCEFTSAIKEKALAPLDNSTSHGYLGFGTKSSLVVITLPLSSDIVTLRNLKDNRKALP
jgi:hypothetical protein